MTNYTNISMGINKSYNTQLHAQYSNALHHNNKKETINTMSKQSTQLSQEAMTIDILQSQKQLMDLYCSGMKESSCPKMRDLLTKQFGECANDQFSIFEWMSKQGIYPIENAEAQKVTEQKEKFGELQKLM
jgi:spore coat protein CotF